MPAPVEDGMEDNAEENETMTYVTGVASYQIITGTAIEVEETVRAFLKLEHGWTIFMGPFVTGMEIATPNSNSSPILAQAMVRIETPDKEGQR